MTLEFTERTGSDNPLNGVDWDGNNSTVAFVDLDNDSDLDAFVGKGTGLVSYYENTGSASSPNFPSGDTSTYSSLQVGTNPDPTFVDIDNDGDFDAFVGQEDGTVTYFKNTGSASSATFTEQDDDLFGTSSLDISNSAVAFTDIDNDNDLDAFVGKDIGDVAYYENTGNANNHDFSFSSTVDIPVDIDSNANPTFVDVDNDGDFDAFVGAGDGTVSYYENTGSASSATFTERTGSDNPFDGIDFGDDSAPVFADIDNDGDYDAFIGSSDGTISYFENTTTVSITAVTTSTAEVDEETLSNHGQFTINVSKTAHGGLNIDFSVNSNAQRGNSGASRLGDDYLLYYLDGSTQKYINGDYFTIEDGTDELTVYVEPLDNTVYESDETITITLSDSDEYDLDTSNNSVSVTIVDNEPTVSISNYTPTIYETAADFGDALSFDGVDDYVELLDGTVAGTFDSGSSTFTITGWLKPSALSSDTTNHSIENVFLARASDAENDNFELGITTDGKLNLYLDTNGGDTTIELGNGELTTGEWHSFALVFNSGSVTAYIDGTEYTGSVSGTQLDEADGSPLTLGKSLHVDTFYNGEIDELGIWNTALTEDAIDNVRYTSLNGDENNLVAYYNFDENYFDGNTIADLTENANDGTLTNGNDTNFVDSEIPTFVGYIDLELDNEVTNEPGIIVNYQIDSDSTATQDEDFYNSQTDVSTTDGEPQTNSIFIPKGEDSGRIYLTALPDAVAEDDETINLTILPDFNQAISLDGSDDYIELADETVAGAFDQGSTAFTITGWLKPNSLSSDDTNHSVENVFLARASDSFNDTFELGVTTGGNLDLYLDTNGGDTTIQLGNGELTTGNWHSVAVVFEAGDVTAYIDGNKYTGSVSGTQLDQATGSPFTIGGSLHVDTFYDGEIEELGLWDATLSESEIEEVLSNSLTGDEANLVAHYNFNQDFIDGKTIIDSTDNSNDGALVTNNEALSLDGSNDYVDIPGGDGSFGDFNTSNFTSELWFKTDSDSGTLIGAGSSADFWRVYLEDGYAKFDFDTGGNASNPAISSEKVDDGEWHHIAAVRTANRSGSLYLDGNLVDTTSYTKNSSIDVSSDVYIGNFTDGNDYFDGEIDEVRVWNVARSETEIQDNLYSNLNGDEDDLIAYYIFDDSNAFDVTSNSNDGTLFNDATTIENDNSDLLDSSLSSSIAYDPFTAGGATYQVDGTTSVNIEIKDSGAYTPGVVIVDEYGDRVTSDNPVIVDEDGNGNFFVKLTSEPTDTVGYEISLSTGSGPITIALSFDRTNWDTPQSISSLPTDINFTDTFEDSETIEFSSNDSNYDSDITVYFAATSDIQKLRVTEGGTILEETILSSVEITNTSDAFPDDNQAGEVNIGFSPAVSESFTLPFSVSGATNPTITADELDSLLSLDDALSLEDDQYVVVSNSSSLNINPPITMEAWIKVDSFSQAWQTVIGKDNSWWQLSRNDETNTMYFGVGDSGGVSGNTNIADGEWHHVAGVYNQAELLLYVDGELDGQSTTGLFQLSDVSSDLLIGNSGAENRNFAGEIDEVRVWSTARSQEEIKAGLAQSLTGSETDLEIYYSFNEDSVSDTTITDLTNNGYDGTLTNGDSDNFVTTDYHQGNLNIAAGQESATISIAGVSDNSDSGDETVTVSLQSGDDYNLDLNDNETTIAIDYEDPDVDFVQFTTAGNLELRDEVAELLDIELAQYVTDDSGEQLATFNVALSQQPTADVTVTFNDVDNTVVTFTTDNWNESQQVTVTEEIDLSSSNSNSLSLDGIDDHVDLNADIVDLATADFTIEAWIKTTGTQEGIVVKTDGDSSWERGEKAFYLNGDGKAFFVGFGNSYIRGTTAVNDGEWHHVAVTWDYSSGTSGTGKIYVDGVEDTASSSYKARNADSYINNNHLRIGSPNYGEAPNYFSGEINEVRAWNTARTETEIQDNLDTTLNGDESGLVGYWNFDSDSNDSTNILDLTSNGNDGTLTNGDGSNLVADTSTELQVTITSTDSTYNDRILDLPISTSILDIAFDPTNPDSTLVTSEEGDSAEFGVRLTTAPDGDVILDLSISDDTEGQFATDSPTQLTFTSENWDTYQTVIVEGVNDTDYDGNTDYTVDFDLNPNSTTTNYANIAIDSVTVTNQDNETEIEIGELEAEDGITEDDVIENSSTVVASLSVDNSAITEAGTATFTVNLSEAVTEDTVVKYEVIDGSTTSGDDYTALTGEVTVTNGNSSATIDLTPIDDEIDEDSESLEIQLLSPSSNVDLVVATAYDGSSIGLQLNNGTEDIQISPGDELVFGDVVATVNTTDVITISDSQTTSVDVILDNEIASIEINETATVIIPDDSYILDDVADDFSATVTINDNDTAKVLITSDAAGSTEITSLTTDESTGTAETFYVQLDSQPTDNVVVYLGSNDTKEGLLSDADETFDDVVKLAFSPTNWDTAQEVKINPVDDNVDESPSYQQFDLSSVFDSDVVINTGDSSQDVMDNNYVFITDTYASSLSGNGNGLPDDGYFAANGYAPEVQLAYSEDEATDNLNGKIVNYGGDPFSFSVEEKAYSSVHLFATSALDSSNIEVTLNYSDGSTSNGEFTIPDWYDEITETEDRYYLIDGVDRYNANTSAFQNANDPAIFGIKVDADTSKTLSSVTVSRKTTGSTNSRLTVFGGTGVYNDDANDYQIISTVISDDVKYNEDNVVLEVNGDYDASSDTTISLAIGDLGTTTTELLAGTQLSFTNGMVLEVVSDVTLSNSTSTDVSVTQITEATRILVDNTATIDDDSDNSTEYTNLIVTEAYEVSSGTLELQIDEDSSNASVDLVAGEQLTFSNGVVFTLDSDVTLSNNESTVVSGAIDSNLLKVAITEASTAISGDITAEVTTDVTDDASGETQVIVTTSYDSNAGTISLQINDISASAIDLLAGTQINLSNGAAVILNDDVTLTDTAPTEINVTGVDNEIITNFTETISTDITVTNTDDDTAGVTITASDTSTTEGLSNNFFSVKLDSQPLGEVEITFNPSNDDIQLNDEFDGESLTLTFDADNWSIPQNVNVIAVDDYDVEYDHSSTISVNVSSNDDSIYNQVTPPNDIEIKIADNDLPVASIEAVAGAAEAGAPGYFIITLDNPAPNGVDDTGILVNYTVSGTADTDETGDTDDLKPLTGSVRIAPGETRSPLIAFPIDDFIVEYEDGTEDTVIIALSTSDDYQLNDANTATLQIEDNDEAGIRIVEVGTTSVTENQTSEFYISLLSQPTADVTISLSNLATEQALEVTGISGNDVTLTLPTDASISSLNLGDGATLTLNGSDYTVNGNILINEEEAVTVTLNQTNNIAVGNNLIYSYDELDFNKGSDTLTFNSDNWYKLQTVTVEGIDDNVVEEGDFHNSTIQYSVTSTDTTYDGFTVDDQTINIVDRVFDKDNTTESLTEGFLGLQDAIDNITLPIVGKLSDVSPSFLEDFLDNLIDEVKATEEVTADTLSDSFTTAFDTTISDSGFESDLFNLDVAITNLATDNIEFFLGIEGEMTESVALGSDLGLPALGIGIKTEGGIELGFDYGIDLAFGINQDDGFYLNTEDTSFGVGAELALSDDFSAEGSLAFLQLDITNGIDASNGDNDGTAVDAEFMATLTNPNDEEDTQLTLSELNAARDGEVLDLINYSFSGDATLDLDVLTSFEGDTSFPSFGFNITSEMPIFNYGNADDEEEVGGGKVTLDAVSGTLSTDTANNITITVEHSDDDATSDIRLTKGTELTFSSQNETTLGTVILQENKTFSDGETDTVKVKLADVNDNIDSNDTGATAELESGDFNISFNDITLDLGEFVTDTLDPVIGFVEELIEPFEPIIDVLQTEVELLESLGLVSLFDENDDGAATIIEIASTLATLYSGGENTLKYAQFFDAVTGIIELVETIEELGNLEDETIQIQFGDYVLENFSGASETEDASTIDTESNGDSSSLAEDASETAKSNNKVGNFFAKLDELGIGIPLLEDPFTAINLLLGQDVDLVTYDIPELDIEFGIEEEFPIFGSITGLLEGAFSIYSDLVVGYDTYGISQWKDADFDLEESYKILDGFYLSDVDPNTGEDIDELTLDATIAAGVSASAVVAKATVKGGITGTAALDVTDGGELTGTSDGKLRGSEVLDADSLLDLFTLSGSLEAFLKATVKVGIDVGLFEIMKTVWSEEFSVTLFEFELGSSGGSVSQYYVEGATVFFDSNLNGELEEGEPFTTTDAQGKYSLDVPLLFFDTNDNGKIDPEEGRIVSIGGTDTSSGLEVDTALIAPYGAEMVTPLTTLKQHLIEAGATAEEAEEQLKTALDLPDVNLDTFEPFKAIDEGDERGVQIYQAHNKVQNLFIQGTEFAGELNPDFDSDQPLEHQVMKSIAQGLVKPGKNVDLSNQEDVDMIFNPLKQRISVPNNQTFDSFTKTLAWGNQAVDEAFNDASVESVVEDVAIVKQFVQGQFGHLQKRLAGGQLSPAKLETLLEGTSPYRPLPGLPGLPPLPPATKERKGSDENDTIIAGDRETTIRGASGDDVINGGNKADRLYGDKGDDQLNGGENADRLDGGKGKDNIDGSAGRDKLFGGEGADTLLGGADNDNLFGEAGDDLLDGGEGDDYLKGGLGNDTLYGGAGSDRLRGSEDNDLFVLTFGDTGNTIFDYVDGSDKLGLEISSFTNTTAQAIFENELTITANSGNVEIYANSGNDLLASLSNVDALDISAEDFMDFSMS